MKKSFLKVSDLSKKEIEKIFKRTKQLKKKKLANSLKGKTIAMLFEKPSTRTRVSFQSGIYQLSGHSVYMNPSDTQLSRGESIKDTAKVLGKYVDGIIARVYQHRELEEIEKYSGIPVVNALSDLEHPCQALADFFTIQEVLGKIKGKNIAYFGMPNNISNSLASGSAMLGANFYLYTPKEVKANGKNVLLKHEIGEEAKKLDILYTDVWKSIGEENKTVPKKELLELQINSSIMKKAPKAKVMHCLPAHKGQEISEEAFESKNSIVFQQAENRIHVQKALLEFLV